MGTRHWSCSRPWMRRLRFATSVTSSPSACTSKLPSGRITDILNGRRGISSDTALRLGHYIGNSARCWLNLPIAHALAVAEREIGARIRDEIKPAPVAA